MEFDIDRYISDNTEKRPYNESGVKDGDWMYIHQTKVDTLVYNITKDFNDISRESTLKLEEANKKLKIVEVFREALISQYKSQRAKDVNEAFLKFNNGLISFVELHNFMDKARDNYNKKVFKITF
jgi:hypothetical protein